MVRRIICFNLLRNRNKIIILLLFSIILILFNNKNSSFYYQTGCAKEEADFNRYTGESPDSAQSNETLDDVCSDNLNLTELFQTNDKYDEATVRRHPNLPKFLLQKKKVSSSMPDIQSIYWTGGVYQESWKEYPNLLLYSAHYDTRLKFGSFIHILTAYNGVKNPPTSEFTKNFCHIWFNTTEGPTIVPVYTASLISYYGFGKDGERLHTFFLSCKVPEFENGRNVTPIAVSIVRKRCQKATNILEISSTTVKKKENSLNNSITFGICGKALYYYNFDFSTRLVEWVETMRILGASKIFFYKTKCHPNVQRVLDYYEEEGFVKLITFYFPPPYDLEGTFVRLWAQSRKKEFAKIENIYINDCLLRNKDDFDYIGVFDCDEIPILKIHNSFQELLTFLRVRSKNQPTSYYLKWKTFFGDKKSKLPPLNDTDRSYYFNHNVRTWLILFETKIYESNGKTFHDMRQVAWANPHSPLKVNSTLAPKVKWVVLPRLTAYTAHFTDHPCNWDQHCLGGNRAQETRLHPIRGKVVRQMNKILEKLKL